VPVGVTVGGDPVVLDLKEAAEGGIGPHGLVVGATGSGKSELLRTVVAGLAATHPPDQLAFVLVDFKGGAAFADLAALPQVAGLITNLQSDLSMVDRALAALKASWPGASGCCTWPAAKPICAPTGRGARPTHGWSRCPRCSSWWTSSASC
jgi:DNA segregation ATPase FtsK/SpoIIIE-like protein